MGHIGLLPQKVNKFRLQGVNSKEKNKIFNDAISLSKSGAFAIVIECVVEELAKKIKDNEATALKLLGAIETLQYLNPPAPQPTEVEEPAEVPAA